MKIVVKAIDASDDDCFRYDYVAVVDGKEYLLSPSSLSNSSKTVHEVILSARKYFGPDVEIDWSESFGQLGQAVFDGIRFANGDSICDNCGQWKRKNGGDCLNDCTARGFAH